MQKNGTYILKLPHRTFQEVPQNEDLTMRLAQMIGILVPFHGMIYAIDQTLLYFIQRFDREALSHNFGSLLGSPKKRRKNSVLHKVSVEDFTQLTGLSRDTKYDFTMEKLVPVIDQYCTFPATEKKKLFKLTLFSFLIGNEDLHLKNFSLIRRTDWVELSPAYDLVNSTILLKTKEELALSLRGRKSNFSRDDFTNYYARERLSLPTSIIDDVMQEIESQIPAWQELIAISFLSQPSKQAYSHILETRHRRLFKT